MSFKIKYTSRRREAWDYYRGALRHQKNANIESKWNFKTIGKHSVQRSWADIDSVSEEGSHIIILGRNGNSFIVPLRAFASIEERQSFLRFAQSAVEARSSRAAIEGAADQTVS